MIKKKHICRCGKHVDQITSYIHREEKMRVTVCDQCAEMHGLTEKNVWESVNYNELTEEQKKTPEPNAINN